MLLSRRQTTGPADGQGCLRAVLADLRRLDAGQAECEEGTQQRLLALAQRLARVRSLGPEYARVGFSEYAQDLLSRAAI